MALWCHPRKTKQDDCICAFNIQTPLTGVSWVEFVLTLWLCALFSEMLGMEMYRFSGTGWLWANKASWKNQAIVNRSERARLAALNKKDQWEAIGIWHHQSRAAHKVIFRLSEVRKEGYFVPLGHTRFTCAGGPDTHTNTDGKNTGGAKSGLFTCNIKRVRVWSTLHGL